MHSAGAASARAIDPGSPREAISRVLTGFSGLLGPFPTLQTESAEPRNMPSSTRPYFREVA